MEDELSTHEEAHAGLKKAIITSVHGVTPTQTFSSPCLPLPPSPQRQDSKTPCWCVFLNFTMNFGLHILCTSAITTHCPGSCVLSHHCQTQSVCQVLCMAKGSSSPAGSFMPDTNAGHSHTSPSDLTFNIPKPFITQHPYPALKSPSHKANSIFLSFVRS